MIRIGIVSTHAPERCGLRVYTDELIANALMQNSDLGFRIIGRPFDYSVIDRVHDLDIVHVMHVGSLFSNFSTNQVLALKSLGKKTVCTWHESSASGNRNAYTEAYDRVVIHEKTSDGFTTIYHGVPWKELKQSRSRSGFVGTSGFPIPFKNYGLAAKLAHAVGRWLFAVLPTSLHGDADWVEREILSANPGSVIVKGFPPHEEIVEELSQCDFSIFPYRQENTGIGGSMRVGIGAQRPVVISDVVRFADVLREERFRNEFYVIPSAYPTFENSLPTFKSCADDVDKGVERVPVETLKEMSWKVSAARYVKVYRELMA